MIMWFCFGGLLSQDWTPVILINPLRMRSEGSLHDRNELALRMRSRKGAPQVSPIRVAMNLGGKNKENPQRNKRKSFMKVSIYFF